MKEKIQKSEALAVLRDKFFDECTEPVYEVNQLTGESSATIVRKVSLAPHDLFEWFVINIEHGCI